MASCINGFKFHNSLYPKLLPWNFAVSPTSMRKVYFPTPWLRAWPGDWDVIGDDINKGFNVLVLTKSRARLCLCAVLTHIPAPQPVQLHSADAYASSIELTRARPLQLCELNKCSLSHVTEIGLLVYYSEMSGQHISYGANGLCPFFQLMFLIICLDFFCLLVYFCEA